jgi:nitrous oxidase accessory protein
MAIVLGALLALQAPLVVSPDGPYRTIGAAVAVAPVGAVISVRPGVYREPTVRIEKSLSLLGEAGATLDGEGQRELMVIAAPDVTVRGLRFRNTGKAYSEDRAGLRAVHTRGCRIIDNQFDDTFFGIYLQGVENCEVVGNRLVGEVGREGGTGNGIHAWSSNGLVVRDNQVRGHRDGIYLEFSRQMVVEGNVSEANRRYGLHFMYSDTSRYLRNTFRNNGTGVAVMYTANVEMSDNAFLDNRGPASYGLLLKDVRDARLIGNRFRDNTTALVADGADRIRVERNLFERNGRAIRLLASTADGVFSDNRFEGNTFDVIVNSRRITADFRGNYWDRYRGWDLDRDGIGDIPHYPVRLFGMLVERSEVTMLLDRSLVVRLVDAAERAVPALTPRELKDPAPLMRPRSGGAG